MAGWVCIEAGVCWGHDLVCNALLLLSVSKATPKIPQHHHHPHHAHEKRPKLIPLGNVKDLNKYIPAKYIPKDLGGEDDYVFDLDRYVKEEA